jgi:hypothetical protein
MKMEMEVKLSAKDIEEVVKSHVEKVVGHKVSKVSINVGTKWEGYGQGEREVPALTDITCTMEIIPSNRILTTDTIFTQPKDTKEFREQWDRSQG